jgi:hypothetical protein
MRKLFRAVLLAACAVSLAAQEATDTGALIMFNIKSYVSYFGFNSKDITSVDEYVFSAPRAERRNFSNLAGDDVQIDTPLEFALLSYYSQPIINIRPIEADAILPANNPRAAGLKLGAAVLKELTELKFLDPNNRAAIGRYEGMLQFISGRNGVSGAEIESYYRQGIGALIAAEVDAQFNKVSFLLENYSANSRFSYNAILTRDAQNQYVLSYERPSVESDDKKLSATSLEALSSAMSRSSDFTPSAIDIVCFQAALIPAVVYAEWKTKGVANGVDALNLIKETITNFYMNPTKENWSAITGIDARYWLNDGHRFNTFGFAASEAFYRTLDALSPVIAKRMSDEVSKNARTLALVPNDPRFNVFSIPYGR